MALQVLIQNPESCGPWALCGSVNDDWKVLADALGTFAQTEVENAVFNGEKEITITIRLQEMTDEEVAALPEL